MKTSFVVASRYRKLEPKEKMYLFNILLEILLIIEPILSGRKSLKVKPKKLLTGYEIRLPQDLNLKKVKHMKI